MDKTIIKLIENLSKLTGKKVKLEEGTWSLPKSVGDYAKAKTLIKRIDILKKELYNVLGDDSLFDGLDAAENRGKELLKFVLQDKPELKQQLADLNLKESESVLEESYPSSIDNYPRPSKMKKPDISGMTKSATSYWRDLYIQDEARDILVDKYGKDRGEKTFQGLIDSRGGAFYQAVTEVVMEKAKMLRDLGLHYSNDYFKYNYYAIWQQWMDEFTKQPYKHLIKSDDVEEVKPKTPIQQSKQTLPVVTKTTSGSSYDSKDEMRINDIITKAKGDRYKEERLAQIMADKITDKSKAIRRGNAAEDQNYHNLAKIFFKRAANL